ncbi:MAG: nuclear transport factor 2 family protein [Actinobacteria bacterium]|nr:nuclear transport factor 2 family protein [Actinomycetota bacterium]
MPDADHQPTGTSRADQTVAEWRLAAENHDAARAIACLAGNVVLISPLTAQFTFDGRDRVGDVMIAAFQVIDNIRFHTEVGDDRTRALFYNARCGRQALEEAQLLRFNHDGLITEITLFGRPLPGLTAVMRRIVPLILGRQGRSQLGALLGAATVPLHAATSSGEQRLVPLADPRRPPGLRWRRRVHP